MKSSDNKLWIDWQVPYSLIGDLKFPGITDMKMRSTFGPYYQGYVCRKNTLTFVAYDAEN